MALEDVLGTLASVGGDVASGVLEGALEAVSPSAAANLQGVQQRRATTQTLQAVGQQAAGLFRALEMPEADQFADAFERDPQAALILLEQLGGPRLIDELQEIKAARESEAVETATAETFREIVGDPAFDALSQQQQFRRLIGAGIGEEEATQIVKNHAGRDPKPVVDSEDVARLRSLFDRNSGEFKQVRDAFNRVRAVEASPAGDLALIFNFMKMLDPGSVVRETEFATAENAAGIPTRIRQQWNKVRSGEKLTDGQRRDFMSQAARVFEAQKRTQLGLESEFARVAQAAGAPVDQVVLDFIGPLREGTGGVSTRSGSEPVSDDVALDFARQRAPDAERFGTDNEGNPIFRSPANGEVFVVAP